MLNTFNHFIRSSNTYVFVNEFFLKAYYPVMGVFTFTKGLMAVERVCVMGTVRSLTSLPLMRRDFSPTLPTSSLTLHLCEDQPGREAKVLDNPEDDF
jgi:hypothetical protein